MQLKKETVQELGTILKKKYNIELSPTDLEKFAHSLLGYIGLLLKAKTREENKKFGNSSASRIDNKLQKKENDKTQQ